MQPLLLQRRLLYDRPMGADTHGSGDRVLMALADLTVDLEKNLEATQLAIERAAEMRRLREEGTSHRDIVSETDEPLVVELITENLERLRNSGAAVRQAQAAALYEEGMTMEQIAQLFGVTRQRISVLLRRERDR